MMYDLGHPLTDSEFDNAKRILDSDSSGTLSYAEFKAWWGKADRFEMLKQQDARTEEGMC
jgi:Ca2+-binding EF-hand superfamily protein